MQTVIGGDHDVAGIGPSFAETSPNSGLSWVDRLAEVRTYILDVRQVHRTIANVFGRYVRIKLTPFPTACVASGGPVLNFDAIQFAE